jgi:hypothetical protein
MKILVVPMHAGCSGKQRFATFESAAKVARRQRRGDVRIQAYRCTRPGCGGYHVGEGFEDGKKAQAFRKRRRQRLLEEQA